MGVRAILPGLLLFLLSPWSASAQRDTTIAGHSYSLLPAGTLAETLRWADGRAVLAFNRIAISGPLSAALTDIDTVRAVLSFTDICFLDDVSLDRVVFLAPVRCERAVFNGGISLLGSTFHKELSLSSCRYQQHANFKQARFLDRADFSGSHFARTTSFIEAEFDGRATSFVSTKFREAVYFEQTRFTGATSFQDVHFEGLFSGKEAVWEDDVSFAGVRFRNRTFFWRARFDRTAFFDTARLGDESDFNRAIFGGPAFFRQAVFIRAVHFRETAFHAQVSFAGSRFHQDADFYSARFAVNAVLSASFAGLLDLRHTTVPLLDFRPYSGDPGNVAVDSLFTGDSRLFLQDAGYERVLVRWSHLAGRLAAQDSASVEDLAPVYASLRHQFRSRGLDRDADICYVEWMERRRQVLSWISPERYALQFLDITTRFGTDLRRPGLFALGSILLFAILYRLLQLTEDSRPCSLAACFYFSLFAFLGRIPFHPTGRIRLLLLCEALIGWLSWGLFIATAVVLLSS